MPILYVIVFIPQKSVKNPNFPPHTYIHAARRQLWVAAREDNTLSSRLTRPSHFPSVSFYYFTYIVIWPGSYQDCQIKNASPMRCIFIWQLPILPGRSRQVLSAPFGKSSRFCPIYDFSSDNPGASRSLPTG